MTAVDALIWVGVAVLALWAIGNAIAVLTAIALWRRARRIEREIENMGPKL